MFSSEIIKNKNEVVKSPFDNIKNKEGDKEFWYARDLQSLLGYKEWRNFYKIIEKAKIACESSNNDLSYHFVDINRVVHFGGVAPSNIQDIVLSRYACYLIAQNGNPNKKGLDIYI